MISTGRAIEGCAAGGMGARLLLELVHVPETPERVLLDCSATARLRASPRFAQLFEAAAPPLSRMRTFVAQQRQYRLAEYVYECFELLRPARRS